MSMWYRIFDTYTRLTLTLFTICGQFQARGNNNVRFLASIQRYRPFNRSISIGNCKKSTSNSANKRWRPRSILHGQMDMTFGNEAWLRSLFPRVQSYLQLRDRPSLHSNPLSHEGAGRIRDAEFAIYVYQHMPRSLPRKLNPLTLFATINQPYFTRSVQKIILFVPRKQQIRSIFVDTLMSHLIDGNP